MSSVNAASVSQIARPKAHDAAWAAFIVAFIALVASVSGGEMIKRPPDFQSIWPVAWVISIVAVLIGLSACRLDKGRNTGLVATFAIGLALLASWLPTDSYFANYGDYPWLVVGSLGVLSVIGGALCGLRVLPALSAAYMGLWFYAAFLPPRHDFPIVQRVDGIECRLTAYGTFELRDVSGRPISRLVDVKHVRVEGNVGQLIRLHPWDGFLRSEWGFGAMPKGPVASFTLRPDAPSWTRSLDLRIIVQRWPANPVLAITIPLTGVRKLPSEVRSSNYRLGILTFGWSPSYDTPPPVKALHATIIFSGFSYSGTKNREYRVVDDRGDVVATRSHGCSATPSGTTIPLELVNLNPGAKSIRIELLGESESEKLQTVFVFNRVPASGGGR